MTIYHLRAAQTTCLLSVLENQSSNFLNCLYLIHKTTSKDISQMKLLLKQVDQNLKTFILKAFFFFFKVQDILPFGPDHSGAARLNRKANQKAA